MPPLIGKVCSIALCGKPIAAKGLCWMHYRRNLKWGDPHNAGKVYTLSNKVSCNAAHTRARALWGAARNHPCVECGKAARDWAYDGTDPTQQYGPSGNSGGGACWVFYSLYPEFYMPMCKRCHSLHDGALLRAELREYRVWKQRTGLTLRDIEVVD